MGFIGIPPVMPTFSGKSLAAPLGRVDTPARLHPASRYHANTFAGSRPLFSDYMDDNAPKENPPAGFNKLDLTQLQGFSFGTQWTQDKSSPSESREQTERPRRDDRREGAGAP